MHRYFLRMKVLERNIRSSAVSTTLSGSPMNLHSATRVAAVLKAAPPLGSKANAGKNIGIATYCSVNWGNNCSSVAPGGSSIGLTAVQCLPWAFFPIWSSWTTPATYPVHADTGPPIPPFFPNQSHWLVTPWNLQHSPFSPSHSSSQT